MLQNYIVALPEIVLLAGACALMIVDLFVTDERRRASYWLAQMVLLACALATLRVWGGTGGALVYAFSGLFAADVMGHMLKLAAYVAVSAALAYSRQYLQDRGLLRGELLTLLLFAVAYTTRLHAIAWLATAGSISKPIRRIMAIASSAGWPPVVR